MIQAFSPTYDLTDPGTARRRAAALTALVAVTALPMLAGAWGLWPLLAIPVALSAVLCGARGLALCASVAALLMSLASGHPGNAGGQAALTLAVAMGLGVLAAGRNQALDREVRRAAAESLTDRLTGLPNYAFICDALPRELRRAERYGHAVSLLLIDIDRFKRFNDMHGHAEGNRLLARVGGTLLACARASDIPARFGGEEFVILVPGDLAEAAEAAERIRGAIQESRMVVGGALVSVTVSVGVAQQLAGERLDGADLLARADRGLYSAKQAGRNRAMVIRGRDDAPVSATSVIATPGVRRVA